MNALQRYFSDDLAKLILRVAVAGLLLFHGVAKLTHGIAPLEGMLADIGIPGFLAYGIFLCEVLAPVLILIGLRTRIAALLVAFDMVVAVLLVHSGQFFTISGRGGGWSLELEAFFFLGALALFFSGAGKYRLHKAGSPWD